MSDATNTGTPADRVAEFEAAQREAASDAASQNEPSPEDAAARERLQQALAAMLADIANAAQAAGVAGRWHAIWEPAEGRWVVTPLTD